MMAYFKREGSIHILTLLKEYTPHKFRNLFATYYYNVEKIEQSAIGLTLGHINDEQVEQYITYYDTHIVGDFV
jgi:integrase